MKTNYSVTIGIPAFNEEKSIGQLLQSLLVQKQTEWKLVKIIVVSDASTDCTDEIVKNYNSPKVTFIQLAKRSGTATAQNTIIKKSNSDILVLLNADVTILNSNFVTELIKPIVANKAGLTSVRSRPSNAQASFITKVLATSISFKETVFERWNGGNNIYTCIGRARAFSKKLYSHLIFKNSIGEDAFSYFIAQKKHIPYAYVKTTTILYKLPTTFQDHMKQSIRFVHSQKKQKEYKLPLLMTLKSAIKTLITKPYFAFYPPLMIATAIASFFTPTTADRWSISESSK